MPRTRTRETHTTDIVHTTEDISLADMHADVAERGFGLHEWISRDELRMTIERDYYAVVGTLSIPLGIVALISGVLGFFAGGIYGVLLATLGVLGMFYILILGYLTIRFIHRAYLYMRGARVVFTDGHIVMGEKILPISDHDAIAAQVGTWEKAFDEKFLGVSTLQAKRDEYKDNLWENVRTVYTGGGKMIENMSRSKDSGQIVIALMLIGVVYGAMIAATYALGMVFIGIIGRFFAYIGHLFLVASTDTQYRIQRAFTTIDTQSDILKNEKDILTSLVDRAAQSDWVDGLSGDISTSLSTLGTSAARAVDESVTLGSILAKSIYADIFDHEKYTNWTKKQVLTPIQDILSLLSKNKDILTQNIAEVDTQIAHTADASLQKPLVLVRTRLDMQVQIFDQHIHILQEYIAKLNIVSPNYKLGIKNDEYI